MPQGHSSSFQALRLLDKVSLSGIGLHSGQTSTLDLIPTSEGAGIGLLVREEPHTLRLPIRYPDAKGDFLCSRLIYSSQGVERSLSTIEHLLSALRGMGIYDCDISVSADEIPIMDGSARNFCQALEKAKTSPCLPPPFIEIISPLTVTLNDSHALLAPSPVPRFEVEIDFPDSLIGRQNLSLTLSRDSFINEIAYARTFGFMADAETLKAQGLAKGASPDNAVIIDTDRHSLLNPDGLRDKREFVRHKILDAIGDLMLAGSPILGLYRATKPSHKLNSLLVSALLGAPEKWQLRSPSVLQMDT